MLWKNRTLASSNSVQKFRVSSMQFCKKKQDERRQWAGPDHSPLDKYLSRGLWPDGVSVVHARAAPQEVRTEQELYTRLCATSTSSSTPPRTRSSKESYLSSTAGMPGWKSARSCRSAESVKSERTAMRRAVCGCICIASSWEERTGPWIIQRGWLAGGRRLMSVCHWRSLSSTTGTTGTLFTVPRRHARHHRVTMATAAAAEAAATALRR